MLHSERLLNSTALNSDSSTTGFIRGIGLGRNRHGHRACPTTGRLHTKPAGGLGIGYIGTPCRSGGKLHRRGLGLPGRRAGRFASRIEGDTVVENGLALSRDLNLRLLFGLRSRLLFISTGENEGDGGNGQKNVTKSHKQTQ